MRLAGGSRPGRARCAAAAANNWSMLTDQVVEGVVVNDCEGGDEGEGDVAVRMCPQYLLYALNINQAVIAITRMAAAVKVDEGM